MVSYKAVIDSIEPPNFRDKELMDVQSTEDIIKDLIYCFKKYNDQAKPIAKKFSTGNIKHDAYRIWEFIKNNINYDAEPENYQTTRSFSRIIHDKEGDCKHSALLASSIAWNLGYNVIFRFVSYNRGETYGHVYTLIQDPVSKKKVIIDPLQKFGTEKSFRKHIDYKATNSENFNPMLSRLTGTNDQEQQALSAMRKRHVLHTPQTGLRKKKHARHVPNSLAMQKHLHRVTMQGLDVAESRVIDGLGNREIVFSPSISGEFMGELEMMSGIGRRTKSERQEHKKAAKAKRQEKKADRKEKKEAKGGGILKRGFKTVKRIGLTPVRAAFSTLLLLNVRGFASRLKKAMAIDEGKVKKFATAFGYKWDIFKKQIEKGSVKKALFGSKMQGMHHIEGIGSVVAVTAALTAASPAIIKVVDLLRSLKVPEEIGADISDLQQLKESADDIKKLGTDVEPVTEAVQTAFKPSSAPVDYSPAAPTEVAPKAPVKAEPEEKELPTEQSFIDIIKNLPTPVLIIGGVGLAYAGGKLLKMF